MYTVQYYCMHNSNTMQVPSFGVTCPVGSKYLVPSCLVLSCPVPSFPSCPVWSGLIQSGPVWSRMIPSGPVWSRMIPSDPIWSRLIPFSPFWSRVIPSGPVWSRLVPSGPDWSRLIPSGPFLVPSDPVWSRLVPSVGLNFLFYCYLQSLSTVSFLPGYYGFHFLTSGVSYSSWSWYRISY